MKYHVAAVIGLLAVFVAVVAVQCESSETTNGDIKCSSDRDCPFGWSCVSEKCIAPSDGDETEADTNPNTCASNADCDTLTKVCCNNQCVDKFPDCPPEANCFPGQTCDYINGKCTGEPSSCGGTTADGDEEVIPADGDEEVIPADGDTTDDDPAQTDTEEDVVSTTCEKDSDCAANQICGASRRCVANCTVTGCASDEGTCNTTNGHCEFCQPKCAVGEECNYYNINAWYCADPCEPVCPDGYACSDGICIELRCPQCRTGYSCSASTGYICKLSGGDTDHDRRSTYIPGSGACLPATADCVEGVTECCSGACIMGHCM